MKKLEDLKEVLLDEVKDAVDALADTKYDLPAELLYCAINELRDYLDTIENDVRVDHKKGKRT